MVWGWVVGGWVLVVVVHVAERLVLEVVVVAAGECRRAPRNLLAFVLALDPGTGLRSLVQLCVAGQVAGARLAAAAAGRQPAGS